MPSKQIIQCAGPAQSVTIEVPKFCPACGDALVDRFMYGRSRRYCLTCDKVVFREHKVAAALLLIQDDQILLVQRRNDPHAGDWSLPAGFVDYHEDPCEAALRECREETGLHAEITGIAGVLSGREHNRGADIVIVYQGSVTGGELLAGDDAQDARFFAVDALPTLAFRATRKVVQSWLASHQGTQEHV